MGFWYTAIAALLIIIWWLTGDLAKQRKVNDDLKRRIQYLKKEQ